jgi:hypothetical protein
VSRDPISFKYKTLCFKILPSVMTLGI